MELVKYRSWLLIAEICLKSPGDPLGVCDAQSGAKNLERKKERRKGMEWNKGRD
jgi:hypothetical protein